VQIYAKTIGDGWDFLPRITETESRGNLLPRIADNTDKAGDEIFGQAEKFLVLVGAHRFD